MNIKTHHIGMVVSDLEKAKHFWIDVLGFKLYQDFDFENDFLDAVQNLNSHVKLHIVKIMDDNGLVIELQLYKTHPTPPEKHNAICDNGIRHFAIIVEDVDAYYKKIAGSGYTVLSSPQGSEELGWKLFFARDPEGNLIEIVQEMNQITA